MIASPRPTRPVGAREAQSWGRRKRKTMATHKQPWAWTRHRKAPLPSDTSPMTPAELIAEAQPPRENSKTIPAAPAAAGLESEKAMGDRFSNHSDGSEDAESQLKSAVAHENVAEFEEAATRLVYRFSTEQASVQDWMRLLDKLRHFLTFNEDILQKWMQDDPELKDILLHLAAECERLANDDNA